MFSFAKKFISGPQSQDSAIDSYFKWTLQVNNRGYGLRVLKVLPHSIANQNGLESWFDYIVKINGHELPMLYPSLSHESYSLNDDGSINYGGNLTQEEVGQIHYEILQQELSSIAKNASGHHEVVLDVWNAKGGIIRQVTLPLKVEEDGAIAQEQSTETRAIEIFKNTFKELGVTLQSQHLTTATYVWRILNTHPDSPAFLAQLVPYSDYIIGCDSAFSDAPGEHGLLAQGGESLLSRVVLGYYNHHNSISGQDNIPITLYVYNHDYDILRPVTVNLSRSWSVNGQQRGILGCDVGYGLIHRLPEVVGKFANTELSDDVLFENNQNYSYQAPGEKYAPDVQPLAPPPVPAAPSSNDSFLPSALPPLGVAPPRKKKGNTGASVPPVSLDGLNDYMNEELAKSKELDVQYGTSTSANAADVPPPPPASKS
ncbi:GRASP65 homolog protein 1 [[Candida] railenensis]|uniref:GRASP65 homolog protein 1 n=1 Tax=[Candida] railenensis TaxID=45579 RepID=A0A9P0QL73_9ASCO|nr:GRASP65 homolog protein 1 [[Candida] railenensis]